ncbi:MAG: DoxX family protein [Chlorobi bacterium]|nr:DoxX family protein [Chlorobiota bacterium]
MNETEAKQAGYERFIPLVGRVLLALIFLTSGVIKLGYWDQTAGYMASKGFPLIPFFLAAAAFIEITGALSLILGYRARLGAVLLIVFLIPTTLIFHDFWTQQGMAQQISLLTFLKNFAVMGGLLLVTVYGSGPLSLDSH